MNIGDGNGKVYVGIPRERVYIPAFVDNRDAILARMHHKGLGSSYYQAEGHRVDRNRDRIVHEFLADKGNPEWLMQIDTDMEHPETIVERLLRWKVPIVGGLYFHRGRTHDPFAFRRADDHEDEYGRMCPTWAPMRDEVYDFLISMGVPLRDGAVVVDGVDDKALVECDAIATGAMMIHRSVLESMKPPWFEYPEGGISEDLWFCLKAKELGYPIYCDFSTICGHYHWVPMGQTQFRMNYENRGINVTAYTKRTAAKWWSEFFKVPEEQAIKAIEKGSAAEVGKIWNKKFGNRTPTVEEERKFYKSKLVGKAYTMELLHWNYLPGFNTLRQMLTHIRKSQVLEIGSGIGSVALQLLVQGNDVIAVEVNQTLREFTAMRYKQLADNIETEMGALEITDERWTEIMPDESVDVVVSFDTFEHLSLSDLTHIMENVSRVLVPGGHLIYHANWYQQDIYPMHHNFSDEWENILAENKLVPISTMEAVKRIPDEQ